MRCERPGLMSWAKYLGVHTLCLFYETKADLLEIAVSYCKAGLEGQGFCLWVVAEPLTVEETSHSLKRAVPGFDRYLADRSIEIVAARDWYLQDGTFDLNRVIGGWNEKLASASARGYAGVRVTGDIARLEKKDWKDFCEYEDSLNQAVSGTIRTSNSSDCEFSPVSDDTSTSRSAAFAKVRARVLGTCVMSVQ